MRLVLITLDLKKQKAEILISFFLGGRKFDPYENFPTHWTFILSYSFFCKKNFKFWEGRQQKQEELQSCSM